MLVLGAGAGTALVLANYAQAIGALLTSADAGGVAPLPYAAELLARPTGLRREPHSRAPSTRSRRRPTRRA